MNRWTYEQTDRQRNIKIFVRAVEQLNLCSDVQTEKLEDGWADSRTDGLSNRRADGLADGQTEKAVLFFMGS